MLGTFVRIGVPGLLMAAVFVLPGQAQESRVGGLTVLGPAITDKASGSGPADLTYDALYNCLIEERAMKEQSASIDKTSASIDVMGKKLAFLKRQMDAMSMIEYNQNVEKYNALYKRYGSAIGGLNFSIQLFNSSVESYNQKCYEKSYYQSDYDRAMKLIE